MGPHSNSALAAAQVPDLATYHPSAQNCHFVPKIVTLLRSVTKSVTLQCRKSENRST